VRSVQRRDPVYHSSAVCRRYFGPVEWIPGFRLARHRVGRTTARNSPRCTPSSKLWPAFAHLSGPPGSSRQATAVPCRSKGLTEAPIQTAWRFPYHWNCQQSCFVALSALQYSLVLRAVAPADLWSQRLVQHDMTGDEPTPFPPLPCRSATHHRAQRHFRTRKVWRRRDRQCSTPE